MNRREFLRLAGNAGITAAALTLPGCGSVVTSALTSPTASPAPPLPSGTQSPPTDADWAQLGGRLRGSLVRPHDTGYSTAAQLFNPRFDGAQPAGIVYCAGGEDVQQTVAFARSHGLPLTARSGGHSYAGYSTGPGVVCDVSRINSVTVNGGGTATIGAGARLIDIYAGLAAKGLAIPGGSCPTVGIAGLALGGGQGVVGRKYGLTCDTMREVQIVTADGSLLTCNTGQNSDLFWACRGGGGGNFGVVTSMTFATHSTPDLTLFYCQWPWAAAHDVIAAWQGWIAGIPDELWSSCHALSTTTAGPPAITAGGVFVGSKAGLSPWLDGLRRAVTTPATVVSVTTHGYLDAMFVEAGCSGSLASCHLSTQNPAGTYQREASLGRSDIVDSALSDAAIKVILDGVTQRQANPQATTIAGVALDALGGAINRVAPDATAFLHRSGLCIAQYNATWPTDSSADVVRSNVDGVNALYDAMRPFAGGHAYQNYIDASLADWQHAYYGDNLGRLSAVKSKYDADNFFSFAQSIPR